MKKFHLIVLVLALGSTFRLFPFGNKFIENKGQIADWNGNVRNDIICYGDIPGIKVYITKMGISFVKAEISEETAPSQFNSGVSPFLDRRSGAYRITRTDLNIPYLKSSACSFKVQEPSYFNYYLDHCKEGVLNARVFNSIALNGLQDGVCLKMSVRGSRLAITINTGNISPAVQRFYENISNQIKDKKLGDYCLIEFSGSDKSEQEKQKNAKPMGFDDRVVWASYLGGSMTDEVRSMVFGDDNSMIITGFTTSFNFPTTEGCFQKAYLDGSDGFIVKFDKNHKIQWCTYVGGTGSEGCNGLAISPADSSIWFCGGTTSQDFPITGNAFKDKNTDEKFDGFIGNISSKGHMNYLTYYGGYLDDSFAGIVTNSKGDAFLSGNSEGHGFPVTGNAFKDSLRGTHNVVIVKFDKDFNRIYSSYWGGSIFDYLRGIAIDKSDNVIICGNTSSKDYPVKNGEHLKGRDDAFITKFDSHFNILWSTCFGGSSLEDAWSVATDSEGNILVHGSTTSGDFKTTPCAYRRETQDTLDNFIIKLDSNGGLLWSSLWGGIDSRGKWIFLIPGIVSVDKNDNIALGIFTFYRKNLPVTDTSYQKTADDSCEIYLLLLDKNGKYIYSTYLGGGDEDRLGCFVFNENNNLVVAATTGSKGLTTTSDAFQKELKGFNNGYFIEFGAIEPSPLDTCDETGYSFSNFLKDENIVYSGKSHKNQTSIRLTDSETNSVGAMWYKYLIPVKNGFSTEFSFRMSGGVNSPDADSTLPGADGIAFVIQNSNPNTLGSSGGKIGYDPIPNSIAIEIDLYANDKYQIENLGDPSRNHIAVMSKGVAPNSSNHSSGSQLGIAHDIIDIKPDGTEYYMKIDYNILPGKLRVSLSDIRNCYGEPVIEISNLDISNLLNLSGGEWIYAGFTAATGSSYQNHDILSWEFCPRPTDSQQTGISDTEFNENPELAIYPNPAGDLLYLNTESGQCKMVSIYNLTGQLIRTYQLSLGHPRIDISELPEGMWFAKIETDEGCITYRKFIKK